MTKLLERAFTEASKLPEQDQDAIAYRLLEEMDSERKWDEAFTSSGELLSQLAAEALEEHRTGQTQDLDPDRL